MAELRENARYSMLIVWPIKFDAPTEKKVDYTNMLF